MDVAFHANQEIVVLIYQSPPKKNKKHEIAAGVEMLRGGNFNDNLQPRGKIFKQLRSPPDEEGYRFDPLRDGISMQRRCSPAWVRAAAAGSFQRVDTRQELSELTSASKAPLFDAPLPYVTSRSCAGCWR